MTFSCFSTRVDAERRIEDFAKNQKKKKMGGQGLGLGVQGGCDRRIEVFGKIHKKKMGGSGWVDVNEELKFL